MDAQAMAMLQQRLAAASAARKGGALLFSVTSEQEIGVDCGPGNLEPFSYVPIVWNDVFEIFVKEADGGNRIAVNNLGVCYQFGRGVTKDEKKAVEYYEKAIKQGSVLAQNNLSMCYLRGSGVDMDEEKAMSILIPLAEQGCLMAVSNMGSCYLNGEGVKKDPRRAMDWYERAANEGFAPSQCYLGVMYESGACKEVGKNDALAAEWFEKAAQQNFKYACYNVAVCYEQGEGVEKDEKKAAEYYEKAALQGELDAQYEIGLCYLYGSGVRRDITRAMSWLTKAAAQNHAKATRMVEIDRAQGIDIETQAQSRIAAFSLPTNQSLLRMAVYCHQIDQINLLHICENLKHNKTLQTFVMDGTDGVYGDVLAEECALALEAPGTALYRLRLYANLQRAKGTVAIAQSLHKNKTLAHLDVSCNYITGEGVDAITKALTVNKHLMSLNISGCDVKPENSIALFRSLQAHPSLTSFDGSQNFYGEDACLLLVTDVLRGNPGLHSVFLHGCALTPKVVTALAGTLSRADCALTTLQLSANDLKGDAMVTLSNAFKVNTSVTSLNVGINPVGDAGAQAMADALTVNNTLKELKMDDTELTAAGMVGFGSMLAKNKALEVLLIDHFVECARPLATALTFNNTLREISVVHQYRMHQTELRPVCHCAETLMLSLSVNRGLRSLKCPWCSIAPIAAQPVIAALEVNHYLQHLTIRAPMDEGIARLVEYNHRVQRRVDRNWQGVCVLVSYLRANTASALGASGVEFLQTILKMSRDQWS